MTFPWENNWKPLEVWTTNCNGQWTTDRRKLWNYKREETEVERTLKVLKRSESKDWIKLYATSSLTSKKGKLWQRPDLYLKTVNKVLGCPITRLKPHTFMQCTAPQLSGFSAQIFSKHFTSVILFQTYAEQRISCPTNTEKQHC